MGVVSKNRGLKPPKWMVYNNGSKPYEQMDDLGGFPIFLERPIYPWLFLVPVKGGIGSILHPPEGKDYKWYISGIYWGSDATYHLLGEPETTIDILLNEFTTVNDHS